MLSNLIILSDLLHHLVHHFHIKLYHFMIQYTTLPFFKILQNTSKYKVLRSYINLWKSIIRKSINSCLYCSIFLKPPYLWTSVCPCKSVKSSQFYHKFPAISIEELSRPLHCPKRRAKNLWQTLLFAVFLWPDIKKPCQELHHLLILLTELLVCPRLSNVTCSNSIYILL